MVKEILEKKSTDRLAKDLGTLKEHFSSMLFFQKFNDDNKYREICKQLLKSLKIKRYAQGEEVFRHNSISDK